MSHKLIDLNDDLRQLREDGYNIDIQANHLVIRDVPYLNEKLEVVRDGIFVSTLNMNGERTNPPSPHTMYFIGSLPYTHEGKPFDAIRPSPEVVRISDSLTTSHNFSTKPWVDGQFREYTDYREKVKTYANLLTAEATHIDSDATAKTFQVIEPEADESPFEYLDTASARAAINMATQKLAAEKVAIVGLGGTGSYILDLIAKTPVKRIYLFDGDKFSSHNAFRSPGAASKHDLHQQSLKVDYFKTIYTRMHRGIIARGEYVDATNIEELRGMDCVFLAIDSGPKKKHIIEKLEEFGVLFIDTGIGLYAKDDTLGGIIRVSTSDAHSREMARARMSFSNADEPNEYDKNIQVADLNMLNAVLAVVRWKKMRDFYFDHKHERFTAYTIGGNMLLSEDLYEPD